MEEDAQHDDYTAYTIETDGGDQAVPQCEDDPELEEAPTWAKALFRKMTGR